MAERKTKTSTAVKTKYNKKVYDVITVRVPKEMAESFKKKCIETGEAQAQVIKRAISEYIEN